MDKLYIGVDVGGTSVKLGLIREDGSVIRRKEAAHRHGSAGEKVMDRVIRSIRELLEEEGISAADTAGIGVSSAGCIRSSDGSVAENGGNIPDWSYTEVCRILRDEFGIPAALVNDGNAAVLGEFWAGAARGYSDVLGVILGTGVGGGIVTGGRLLEGSRGYAGEIGHFPTHAGGRKCLCGLAGCYERYASTSALTKTASSENAEWDNGRTFFEAVSKGDSAAGAILDEWIGEIASGIAGLVHIFDPQIILIGGGVSGQKELLIDPLRERVLSMVMPDFADGLELRGATLGNDAGMVGAVYYLISRT